MSHVELMRVCRKGGENFISFSSSDLNQFDSARRIVNDFSDLIENGICRSHPIDHINVDFGGIDRISSVGLNGLIQMNSKSRSHGVRLVLMDVPESVLDVFRLTRMERMFEFGSTTENVVSTA
jgi:anti-anti-sigma factor